MYFFSYGYLDCLAQLIADATFNLKLDLALQGEADLFDFLLLFFDLFSEGETKLFDLYTRSMTTEREGATIRPDPLP